MDTFRQLDGNLLIGIQHALNAEWLTPIMKLITLFGEAGIFWIVLCLALIINKKTRRLGIICGYSLAFTFLCCNIVLKPLVDRTRPWVTFAAVHAFLQPPGDSSFPSGHSANSMAPAWAMFYATMPHGNLGNKRLRGAVPCLGWRNDGADPVLMHRFGTAAVILALLIGLSRLYLGMHYPSDVVCGLLLGMICATIVYRLITKAEQSKGVLGSPARIDRMMRMMRKEEEKAKAKEDREKEDRNDDRE